MGVDAAVDEVPVLGNPANLPQLLLFFVPDFADDLLDQVLHGDQAVNASVLVAHEDEMHAVLAHFP